MSVLRKSFECKKKVVLCIIYSNCAKYKPWKRTTEVVHKHAMDACVHIFCSYNTRLLDSVILALFYLLFHDLSPSSTCICLQCSVNLIMLLQKESPILVAKAFIKKNHNVVIHMLRNQCQLPVDQFCISGKEKNVKI